MSETFHVIIRSPTKWFTYDIKKQIFLSFQKSVYPSIAVAVQEHTNNILMTNANE